MTRPGLRPAIFVAAAATLLAAAPPPRFDRAADRAPAPLAADAADIGCVSCHSGIEDMHPWAPLGCVECHGGDGAAKTKEGAHVRPSHPPFADERVAPLDDDPAYRRFLNPTDLRVVDKTCARCHGRICDDLKTSLHGTTAGHLSDGLYENGVVSKRSSFSIFPVKASNDPEGRGLSEMKAVGGYVHGPPNEIATHYRDVVRKSCMHCHLWSRGRAVRGRAGMDGDYRSEGCAACHVTYTDRGFSESADPTIDRREPGRPRKHEMTSAIPTDTCTRCHYGDANIGLAYRGLAQLVPGQPAGPDVPGTTGERKNGVFYMNDPAITPPDVHHERGMHCVDCHTARDAMGDGVLHANMDHAVEIECSSCHGTLEARADGRTEAGTRLRHLSFEKGGVFLTSKVDGKKRRVKQAVDVIDPNHEDFNPNAREAMTSAHKSLECYACHANWNVDFFGFHFDRNESFTQLDLISGERTPGRVTTQEKVFATFKHLTLGLNHENRFAPYLVGFSTTCSAHDKDGKPLLDQAMPKTAAGLSGMTMIHHQPHTTRRDARQCAECHRSGPTWGLGTGSFSLARGSIFAAGPRGFASIAVDRKAPDRSLVLAEARVGPARATALLSDPITGFADVAYVGVDGAVLVLDVSKPAFPRVVSRIESRGTPEGLLATDRTLYVAAAQNGLQVFDLKDRLKPSPIGSLGLSDARGMALAGFRLFVADGVHGLVVVDVADPAHPKIESHLPLPGDSGGRYRAATTVAEFFQFSRPKVGGGRTRARQLAAIGGPGIGLLLVDATTPRALRFIGDGTSGARSRNPLAELGTGRRPTGLVFTSKFELGTAGGGVRSEEHDDLYASTLGEGGEGRLFVVRVTDPTKPVVVDRVRLDGPATGVSLLKLYNAPFLVHGAAVSGFRSTSIVDLTRAGQGVVKATLPYPSSAVVVDAMAFDRMITEEGAPLKDVAHDDARYVDAAELRRLLSTAIPDPEDRFGPDPTQEESERK
jgi:hypothetical protein